LNELRRLLIWRDQRLVKVERFLGRAPVVHDGANCLERRHRVLSLENIAHKGQGVKPELGSFLDAS